MVSASPVSVWPWQTLDEVRCHLFIPPSKTPEMTVAEGNKVSPVAAGKTEVALVGVPVITAPPPAVVVGFDPAVVVGFDPAVVVTGVEPPG